MTTLTETLHAGAFVVSEAEGFLSRDQVTIAISQTLVAGQVLGKVAAVKGAVTVAAPAFTGTGNGTLTRASPAYGAGVQVGTYTARLIEAGANAGSFEVVRPDGTIDGIAEVAVAYTGQVKFTIADGSTDFSAAAQFTLAVTIAEATDAAQWKALNLSAADGSQIAAGVLYDAVTTDGSTTKIAAVINRVAEVRGSDLTWPGGISAGDKATAIAQLAALNVIVR